MSKNKATAQRKAAAKKKNSNLNKLYIIGGIVVVLFIAIILLQNKANETKLADNPYGTDDLNQATIDQLGDKNYQNIILPEQLEEKIASGEGVFAYFFSPTCVHCQAFTPVLMPLADEAGAQIDQLNLLEFDLWSQYNIEATPTLVYFKDGKEVNRLVGNAPADSAREFLETMVQ